jgi:hypothetical protein
MVSLDGYACVPICIGCRQAGFCGKAHQAPRTETIQVRVREWAPNRLPYITLPCGCRDIPWPIVHVFATDIYRIECDIHGTQTLSKNWKEKAKKQAKKYKQESEQPEALGIPPF